MTDTLTKQCKCGNLMIERQAPFIKTSSPPQWDMEWWCACGIVQFSRTVIGETQRQRDMKQWEAAQKNN